ncbi:MAG: mitochondrial fission ELM1 family protein [Rhodospirillales bacterium]
MSVAPPSVETGAAAAVRSGGRPEDEAAERPSVWLVLGDKLGDNAQVEIIAAALPWPCRRKRLCFDARYAVRKPLFRPSVHHVVRERSDPLAPPWPDLVLTVGRRPSMVALWIRKQSGGRTRIVIVGRPRRMLDRFALVVATPQYRLPDRTNVLNLDLPLMRIDEARVAEAVLRWRPRLAGMARPLTAVLVGGPTQPLVLDADVARLLVERIRRSPGGGEGSLFVSTSRRTPPAVVDALARDLPAGGRLYRWDPAADDNPYPALLGLADRFVVTGDSISMIVEVARLGKPLAIFPLPVKPASQRRLREAVARLLRAVVGRGGGAFGQWLRDGLYNLNLITHPRDFAALHDQLIARGFAVRLGDPFPARAATVPDEVPRVVERIETLMAGQLRVALGDDRCRVPGGRSPIDMPSENRR